MLRCVLAVFLVWGLFVQPLAAQAGLPPGVEEKRGAHVPPPPGKWDAFLGVPSSSAPKKAGGQKPGAASGWAERDADGRKLAAENLKFLKSYRSLDAHTRGMFLLGFKIGWTHLYWDMALMNTELTQMRKPAAERVEWPAYDREMKRYDEYADCMSDLSSDFRRSLVDEYLRKTGSSCERRRRTWRR